MFTLTTMASPVFAAVLSPCHRAETGDSRDNGSLIAELPGLPLGVGELILLQVLH